MSANEVKAPENRVGSPTLPSPAASPGLRVVRPSSAAAAPRAPFVVAVLLLLLAGLGGLLTLNTLLAQGAFTVHDLDQQVASLRDKEAALEQRVATLAAPTRLMRQARAIGMVPSTNPAFVRIADGRVLGEPVEAGGSLTGTGSIGTATSGTDPNEARLATTNGQGDEGSGEPSGGGQQQGAGADRDESEQDKAVGDENQPTNGGNNDSGSNGENDRDGAEQNDSSGGGDGDKNNG